jgi:hypothetical protein
MFDLLVAEFKDKLVATINESQLPPTAIAYVLQDAQQQVAQLIQEQVKTQRDQRDAAAKELVEPISPLDVGGAATGNATV